MLLLCGCLSQTPAPVSLRGEEFYGDEEKSEKSEYRLIRDKADGAPPIRSGRIRAPALEEASEGVGTVRAGPEFAKCGFSMPLSGRVVSSQNTHSALYCGDGVAVVRRELSQVTAAHDGRVMYIGKGLKWYGNLVILEHDKYTITMYYNVDGIQVKIGDEVRKGDVLATTSPTKAVPANNNIEHFCCFSMRYDGKPVDPVQHIKNCEAEGKKK